MKKLFCVVMSIFLIGCSSKPITEESGETVPGSLIVNKEIIINKGGMVPVTFLRDTGPGAACSHTIYVNGVKAFYIQDGQYITIYLSNGPHFFRLTSGNGLCPNIDISQQTIIANNEQKFRIMFQSNSGTINLIRFQ
jgi:hypothetical protein